MDELTPPHGFGPDEAEAVIEASEAAFATLAVLEGTTDWRSADAFPRRFSSEVAGYLVNGHGIVPAAAAPGDRQASAAVRIVERAARYAALEIAQAGGNTLTPSEQRLMDAFRQQAYDLSRKPAKAAALSVAVCRLLRDTFARIGIPADSLPECKCPGAAPGAAVFHKRDASSFTEGAADGEQCGAGTEGVKRPPAPVPPAPPAPTGVYKKLAAASTGLKLKQKLLVDAIVASGKPVPLADLQLVVVWSGEVVHGWNNMSAAVNKKLRRHKLVLFRENSCGCVREVGRV